MKIQQAKRLLTVDFSRFDLEKLQKFHVKLIDAWRESRADYGYMQAVQNGFYAVIASESAKGFKPVDIWLERNLLTRLNEVENALQSMY